MGSPYKALAGDARRDILKLLSKKELPVGEIAARFVISKPAISAHLKILLDADLITTGRDRQLRIYKLTKVKIKEIVKFLELLTEVLEE